MNRSSVINKQLTKTCNFYIEKNMKPKTVVTSLAENNLEKSLAFYRDRLGIETPGIEEGIIPKI